MSIVFYNPDGRSIDVDVHTEAPFQWTAFDSHDGMLDRRTCRSLRSLRRSLRRLERRLAEDGFHRSDAWPMDCAACGSVGAS